LQESLNFFCVDLVLSTKNLEEVEDLSYRFSGNVINDAHVGEHVSLIGFRDLNLKSQRGFVLFDDFFESFDAQLANWRVYALEL